MIPGPGRSPGEGKGYPLQYSGLENSMDCIVHRVAKSQTRLSDFCSLTHSFVYLILAGLGLLAAHGLSPLRRAGSALQLHGLGISPQRPLLLKTTGFHSCTAWAQQLWCSGLVTTQQCRVFPEQGLNPHPLYGQVDS